MRNINLDESELIKPTDFEAKFNAVFDELHRDLFAKVELAEAYENEDGDLYSDGKKPKKRKFAKNEIAPLLTPVQVNSKLNELLRIYRPMNEAEAKEQPDFVFLSAFKWYMHLITEINRYLVFLPSKQSFCAFANITVAIYNELYGNPNFTQVFSSIEDYLVDSNYTSAQSGLTDSKTVLAKLGTKDAGHNLVKNPDSIGNITVNQIDTRQVDLALEQFESMTKRSKK